jgi:hypothetical protein
MIENIKDIGSDFLGKKIVEGLDAAKLDLLGDFVEKWNIGGIIEKLKAEGRWQYPDPASDVPIVEQRSRFKPKRNRQSKVNNYRYSKRTKIANNIIPNNIPEVVVAPAISDSLIDSKNIINNRSKYRPKRNNKATAEQKRNNYSRRKKREESFNGKSNGAQNAHTHETAANNKVSIDTGTKNVPIIEPTGEARKPDGTKRKNNRQYNKKRRTYEQAVKTSQAVDVEEVTRFRGIRKNVSDIKRKSTVVKDSFKKSVTNATRIKSRIGEFSKTHKKGLALTIGAVTAFGMVGRMLGGGGPNLSINPTTRLDSSRNAYMPQSYRQAYDDIKRSQTDFGSRVHLNKTINKFIQTSINSTRHHTKTTVQSIINSSPSKIEGIGHWRM